jgi:hypothetical protein
MLTALRSVKEFLALNNNPCISLDESELPRDAFSLLHTKGEGDEAMVSMMRAYLGGSGLSLWVDSGTVAERRNPDTDLPHSFEHNVSLATLQHALRIFCMFGPQIKREEPFDLLERVRTPMNPGGPGLKR